MSTVLDLGMFPETNDSEHVWSLVNMGESGGKCGSGRPWVLCWAVHLLLPALGGRQLRVLS